MMENIYFNDGSTSTSSKTCAKQEEQVVSQNLNPGLLHVAPIRKVGKMLSPVKTVCVCVCIN